MKRLSCGRRLYQCKHPDHTSPVVWTIKTLGIYCDFKKIQPECRKFCCRHCPHAQEDISINNKS